MMCSVRWSPEPTTADRMFRRFDDIFETCGWRVITLKYGKRQREAFKRPGGNSLEEWIDSCPNADYAALTYQGGAAWRERDRKSVVSGKSVSVRVDLGGRRILKKKKKSKW